MCFRRSHAEAFSIASSFGRSGRSLESELIYCVIKQFNLNGAFTVYFVELLLIYEFKCPNYIFESFHNLVSGVPNNRFTCMRGQKTL